MQKLLSITAIFFGAILAFAQAPEKMSYQAVIKNASGNVLQNQNVSVKASILQGSDSGTVVYSEVLNGTTNSNGLLSAEIGTGTALSGNFSTINWSSGNFWLKTETDPNGGTNYSIAGTSQLLSVPYAMYAKTSGGAGSSQWTANGTDISNTNTGNVGIGTNTPGYKLTVKKNGIGFGQESLDGNTRVGFYTDNTSGAYVQTHTDTDLNFATNNLTAQMTLQKETGNFGIGNDNPTEKLDVNGKTKTTNLQVTNGAGAGKVLTSDASGNAAWQTPAGGGLTLPYSATNSAAGTSFGITNNNGLASAISGSSTGTGFGIYGTTDGGAGVLGAANSGSGVEGSSGSGVGGKFSSNTGLAIQANGNVLINGTTGTGKAPLAFSNANGNKLDIYYGSDTNRYGIGLQSGLMQLYSGTSVDNIAFGYGGSNSFTENMRIKGNGNVGIGTTNPTEKLEVNGKIKAGNLQLTNGAGTGKVLTSDASGNASWQSPSANIVGFTVSKTADQLIYPGGSAYTKVTFSNTDWSQQGSSYSPANSVFTAPATGYYKMDATLFFGDISTGGSSGTINIGFCNAETGFPLRNYQFEGNGNKRESHTISALLYLSIGEKVDVRVYSSNYVISVAGYNTGSQYSYFSGYKAF